MIGNRRGVLTMYLFFLIVSILLGNCKKDDPKPEVIDTTSVVKDAIDSTSFFHPVTVTKTQTAKVYVHLMPWFETPATSTNGQWGMHWTMANKDPNKIVDATTGKREIASHYYPLTGPYASSDPAIIEYQVLLMKLAGIDGVLIDWYGTLKKNDYPANLKNTIAITSKLKQAGLTYALVYEDAVMKSISDPATRITDAQNDMKYLKSNDFSAPHYIHIDKNPLLMTFGPQTFQTPSDWTSIFSIFPTIKPKFLTLWYEAKEAGSNAAGEFSWVYQDNNSHITHLNNFYARTDVGLKMGSAYPGFNDFYTEGGWSDNVSFSINYNDSITFRQTLQKAVDNVSYIQLVTWNDYGEGTMIEPTFEFGYKFLTTLQDVLGVGYTQDDLKLVYRFYELRKSLKDSATDMKKLDQAFAYFASLQLDKAKEIIDQYN